MTGRSLPELLALDLTSAPLQECEERLIARRGDVATRSILAARSDLTLGTIRTLYSAQGFDDRAVKTVLAANPGLDDETLKGMCRYPRDYLAPGLVKNPRLTAEAQRKIAADITIGFGSRTFVDLAGRSDLDPEAATSLIDYVKMFGLQRYGVEEDPIAQALAANPTIDWSQRTAEDNLTCRKKEVIAEEAKRRGIDMETFNALAINWGGSIEDLYEACGLV